MGARKKKPSPNEINGKKRSQDIRHEQRVCSQLIDIVKLIHTQIHRQTLSPLIILTNNLLQSYLFILIIFQLSKFQASTTHSKSMLNSSSLPLSEKKKQWKEHKAEQFQKLGDNKSKIFNYFLQYNDIFKAIDEQDSSQYIAKSLGIEISETYVFFGSMLSIFVLDKLILNKFFPRFRIQEWRLTVNLFKFLFLPICCMQIYRQYMIDDQLAVLHKIQTKYQFGFEDYMKYNKILDRALEVNRLEELIEKRQKFDWTGVPKLA